MIFTPPYKIAGSEFHIHDDHWADLFRSGIVPHTIAAANIYSLAPKFLEKFFHAVPSELETALCFPYQGGDFARIKLFPSLGKMKYAQPPGTGARLYVPFPVSDGPLIIGEGEKKTLAAHQSGFNAVGIGGIWNWLSKATGAPIYDLNLISWDDRDVTIMPDSDVFSRVDLLRAIYALGIELRSLGANVLVAQIPQDGAAKVGLDDYLVAGGDVAKLDVFALSNRLFKNCGGWHSRWKFKKALEAA